MSLPSSTGSRGRGMRLVVIPRLWHGSRRGSKAGQAGRISNCTTTAFWTVELPRGWSLLTTHPLNRDDLPFRTLTGFVDADRFHQVGLLFPARWLDPETPRTLPRGTPIAQCIPLPRTSPALDIGTMDPDAVTAFARTGQDLLSTPGVYRTRFRVRAR